MKTESNMRHTQTVGGRKRSLRDKFAVGLSAACAVHCMATPMLLFLFPAFGGSILNDPWIEFSLLAFVFVLGGSSVLHGYRHHGNKIPPVVFAVAFIGLSLATVVEGRAWSWVLHAALAIILSVTLMWDHLIGHGQTKSSKLENVVISNHQEIRPSRQIEKVAP